MYSSFRGSSNGRLSIYTRDRNGTLIELKDGDYVFNGTYFECKGFELCSDEPGPDLNWSVDNLLDKYEPIHLVHELINDYQISTYGFVPDFYLNVTCKSQKTGFEISVTTSSFGKCIHISLFFMYM